MRKIIWYIKQLFPLTYYSYYNQTICDKNHKNEYKQKIVTVWKMWFGKVFDQKKWIVLNEV